MKFLQQEGSVVNGLNRLIDLILLNVLWFICSLPIFTLGATTCAVYDITMKYALHQEPSIVSTFFSAFKKNFKKGTALFFIFLAMGLFIGFDLFCAFWWDISIKFVMIVVILAVGYFYLAVLSHVFPVLTYFDTGVKETIKKSFLLSMSNGIYTVFIMVLNILPILAIIAFPSLFGQIIFFWFIIGFAVIAFLNSMHLVRLFDPKRVEEADRVEEQQKRLREEEKRSQEESKK